MSSYQILPYHVTQFENLSFSYLKSYCPLNFEKSHQISLFCCTLKESYKEDKPKMGRICPPCGIGLIGRLVFNDQQLSIVKLIKLLAFYF